MSSRTGSSKSSWPALRRQARAREHVALSGSRSVCSRTRRPTTRSTCAHQRPRRGSGAAQPVGPVHLASGVAVASASQGDTGQVRIVCRSRPWRVDQDQNRRAWRRRTPVHPRQRTANADRQRHQVRGPRQGSDRAVARYRDRGALSELGGESHPEQVRKLTSCIPRDPPRAIPPGAMEVRIAHIGCRANCCTTMV